MRQRTIAHQTKKNRLYLPTQEKITQSHQYKEVRKLEKVAMARGITGPEAGVPDCPDLVLFDIDGLALSYDDGRADAALVQDTRSGLILLIDLLQSNFVRVGFFSTEAESLKESIKLLAEETGNPDIADDIAGVANIAGSNMVSTCLLRSYSEGSGSGEGIEEDSEEEITEAARGTQICGDIFFRKHGYIKFTEPTTPRFSLISVLLCFHWSSLREQYCRPS
eukprot:jgi/Bigna1/140116/aug1.54_g14824